jgi:hypothetical protein
MAVVVIHSLSWVVQAVRSQALVVSIDARSVLEANYTARDAV